MFNPATGTFSPTSSLVRNRSGATGVLLVDGRVLVFGYDAVSELYEPANGLFIAGGSAQTSSGLWLSPSLAMLPDDRVLAVSGKEPGPPPTNLALVANARLFDPATSDFILARALIWPRAGSTATRLPDGRVLVFGGEGDGRWPDRGELYDPFTGLFSATVSAGTGRVGPHCNIASKRQGPDRWRSGWHICRFGLLTGELATVRTNVEQRSPALIDRQPHPGCWCRLSSEPGHGSSAFMAGCGHLQTNPTTAQLNQERTCVGLSALERSQRTAFAAQDRPGSLQAKAK